MAKKVMKKKATKSIKKTTKSVKKATKSVKKATQPVKKATKSVKKATKIPAMKPVQSKAKSPVVKEQLPAKAAKKAAAPSTGSAASTGLAVGAVAPAFTLPSSSGKAISLADYGDKTVVLYFYPRADTPGCTVEACGFRDAIASFGKLSVDVLGVSPDPVKEVTRFAEKFKLTFPLLADADHAVCDAYGVWVEKSMYGKKYFGAARSTFIISGGRVRKVFEKVKPEGHEAEVLSALASL